jgi:hypothetical protein
MQRRFVLPGEDEAPFEPTLPGVLTHPTAASAWDGVAWPISKKLRQDAILKISAPAALDPPVVVEPAFLCLDDSIHART